MDNDRLQRVMTEGQDRAYWLKPVGLPGTRATGHEPWDAELLRVDFAVRPVALAIGDLLLAFRIGDYQMIYIAQCASAFQEATPEQIEQNPHLERWRWNVDARNLTPTFGGEWSSHNLRPFRLVEEFNALNPGARENIDGVKFGSDKLE